MAVRAVDNIIFRLSKMPINSYKLTLGMDFASKKLLLTMSNKASEWHEYFEQG